MENSDSPRKPGAQAARLPGAARLNTADDGSDAVDPDPLRSARRPPAAAGSTAATVSPPTVPAAEPAGRSNRGARPTTPETTTRSRTRPQGS